MTQNTRDKLMDRAEQYIRSGGFASFSFRDLANDLGIKSASVHYHFATKSELGEAVALRYNARFSEALKALSESSDSTSQLIKAYILMFHSAMKKNQRMCLCAVFSMERAVLTEEINHAVQSFYVLNVNWLTKVLSGASNFRLSKYKAEQRAKHTFATLQGSLIGAYALQDPQYFSAASRALYQDLFGKDLRLPH